MKAVKVFFDASVLFAALYSSTGASHRLMELVQEGFCIGITTQTIISELENNLHKLPLNKIVTLDDYLGQSSLRVREAITLDEIKPWVEIIELKDVHVVAGAILTGCDYLVTLDKKHLHNPAVQQSITEVMMIAPRELLYKLLDTHPNL